MIRTTLTVLTLALALSGCARVFPAKVDKDSPFAPGVDYRKEAVDGLTVGNRLLANKEYNLALDAFTRAAMEEGFTGETYAGLGAANFGLGRLGQAEKQLREAVKSPDAPPEAWNNLGLVLIEKGELPEAVEVLRRAFALSNGQNDEIRENLRLALAMQGKNDYDPDVEQELDLVQSGKGQYRLHQQVP